jgi:hypothetical protein
MDIKIKPYVKFININQERWVKDRCNGCIWNGLLISKPLNPIFLNCINEIVENAKFKRYGNCPLSVTGPALLGKYVLEKSSQIVDLTAVGEDSGPVQYIEDINHNKIIKVEYEEYREEQNKTKNYKPYYEMWKIRDIYT